jgi:ADP-ribosylglycohydrolase
MTLTAVQNDRAAGVLLAQACGDALGVPYEFRPRLGAEVEPEMVGGGLGDYAPGEWSDDTQMAACIATVTATGADIREGDGLDAVAEWFEKWYADGPADVGNQTAAVLSDARRRTGPAGQRLTGAAQALHGRTGHTAGNGALMRTGVVALPYLGDDEAIAAAARAVAGLTHADPLAGDSCVLWCIAIDRAVREGRLDGIEEGLPQIPVDRREQWAQWLAEARLQPPRAFPNNGFTVTALQAALSAVLTTATPPQEPSAGSFAAQHLQLALTAAVRAGHDTDTVAAIAGALLGARWGASAVPFAWRRKVHGWPGLRGRDLQRLGLLSVWRGQSDAQGWPADERLDYGQGPAVVVPHPCDDKVLLGTANSTGADEADAVVSLCRLGAAEAPRVGVPPEDHVEVWLVDSDSPSANANLEFVIDDAARAVAALRDEGKTVLLHCVRAEMRTPAVAARYAVLRGVPVEDALRNVRAVLPNSRSQGGLHEAVRALGDAD